MSNAVAVSNITMWPHNDKLFHNELLWPKYHYYQIQYYSYAILLKCRRHCNVTHDVHALYPSLSQISLTNNYVYLFLPISLTYSLGWDLNPCLSNERATCFFQIFLCCSSSLTGLCTSGSAPHGGRLLWTSADWTWEDNWVEVAGQNDSGRVVVNTCAVSSSRCLQGPGVRHWGEALGGNVVLMNTVIERSPQSGALIFHNGFSFCRSSQLQHKPQKK